MEEYIDMISNSLINRWTLIFQLVCTIVGFIFKAIGLNEMARRKGLENRWLCFVPFANFIIMGKLVGVTYVFRNKVNNLGVIICILLASSAIVSGVLNLGFYLSELSLMIFGREDVIVLGGFLKAISEWTGVIYFYVYVLLSIVNIMGIIFEYFLLRALFIKYDRKNGNVYSIVAILGYIFDIDILAGIFVFVCRKKVPVEFTQFQSRRTYYSNNQYNGNMNNGNQYNGYNGNANNDDPFPEFGDNNNNYQNNNYSNNNYQSNNYQNNNKDDKVDDDLFD